MTLAFSKEINGKPTYFKEKICESIFQNGIETKSSEFVQYGLLNLTKDYVIGTHQPKMHTIRRDSKDRWKVGNKIHMVYGNRTKHRVQFAPIIEVVSTQEISIIPFHHSPSRGLYSFITVNGKQLTDLQINDLALNDGFESTEDFWNYFQEDFHGKIIHWTDINY